MLPMPNMQWLQRPALLNILMALVRPGLCYRFTELVTAMSPHVMMIMYYFSCILFLRQLHLSFKEKAMQKANMSSRIEPFKPNIFI